MEWISVSFSNLISFLSSDELWKWVIATFSRILIIIVLAYVAKFIGNRVIDSVFKERSRIPLRLTTNRREQTLKNLLRNILSYVIVFIVILMILDTFEVPIKTMLAGAGVVGLAVGFGAQNLVKDIIAGFFIIFEDQFAVGDYIETGDIEGDVEVIGLRTTKLRSFYGQTYVIPNGQMHIINNYSVSNGFAMVEIKIPYEANHHEVEQMVEGVLERIPSQHDVFVGRPFISGVKDFEYSSYILRIRAETLPVMQWEGARIIRKEIKENLFENGIDIPSPRVVVSMKDKKEASM